MSEPEVTLDWTHFVGDMLTGLAKLVPVVGGEASAPHHLRPSTVLLERIKQSERPEVIRIPPMGQNWSIARFYKLLLA